MSAQYLVPLDHRIREHPDYQQLQEDSGHFWRRMMASVARPSTISGEIRQLRVEVDQLRRVVEGGRW